MTRIKSVLQFVYVVTCILGSEAIAKDSNVQQVNLLFDSIKELNLVTGNVKSLLNNQAVVRAIEIDYKTNFLYWSDDRHGTIARLQYSLQDNKTTETIAKANHPRGIAVDTNDNDIYWTEFYAHRIMRCDLDNEIVSVMLKEDLEYPHALALDKEYGWLYFSQTGKQKRIERIRLDGSDREVLISSGISSVLDIAIDANDRRMYWTDDYLNIIKSSTLDGSDIKDFTKAQFPSGIDIFGSYIFYTNWYDGQVLKVDKTSKKPTELHSNLRGSYIYAVCVYDPQEYHETVTKLREVKRPTTNKPTLTNAVKTEKVLQQTTSRLDTTEDDYMPTSTEEIMKENNMPTSTEEIMKENSHFDTHLLQILFCTVIFLIVLLGGCFAIFALFDKGFLYNGNPRKGFLINDNHTKTKADYFEQLYYPNEKTYYERTDNKKNEVEDYEDEQKEYVIYNPASK